MTSLEDKLNKFISFNEKQFKNKSSSEDNLFLKVISTLFFPGIKLTVLPIFLSISLILILSINFR